jgi:hypothetical protein
MTPEQLEVKINEIQKDAPTKKRHGHVSSIILVDLEKLTDNQLFALLAWELWKDGADDWAWIESIVQGKDMQFKTRSDCISYLKTVFGY